MIPVKIVTLTTGERIICGYSELAIKVVNENLPTVMLLKCPYILELLPVMTGEFLPDGNPKELTVNFKKWNPYTPEKQFKVPVHHMLSVAEPDPQILDIYIEKFGDDLYEWDRDGINSVDSIEEPGIFGGGDTGEGGES